MGLPVDSKGVEGAVCIDGTAHWIQGHEDEDTGTSHIDNGENMGVECDDWDPLNTYKLNGPRISIVFCFNEG